VPSEKAVGGGEKEKVAGFHALVRLATEEVRFQKPYVLLLVLWIPLIEEGMGGGLTTKGQTSVASQLKVGFKLNKT
jgi:hypothetical protein